MDLIRALEGKMGKFRLWLWRMFLMTVWIVVYWILPEPLDTGLATLTGILLLIWLYNRASGRLNLPPLRVKFERIETITPTHILLALILLVMLGTHSEIVHLKKTTADLQDSVTDLQSSVSDSTDQITSGLDDVKTAIEASQ